MSDYQAIDNIAELLVQKGITYAVLCPGSRCAPLTLAFVRHPRLRVFVIPDERSAGFIALGIAQQLSNPVAIVCTSGTAAYNFAPAVAEAFFSETPLLVFTADRPAEWIAQQDGQTIYQYDIFGKHVKQSFQLPQTYGHADEQWAINRIVNEAVNLCRMPAPAPVHVNAPFREPLYPNPEEVTQYDNNVRVIKHEPPRYALDESLISDLKSDWNASQRILVVAGQLERNERLCAALQKLASYKIPVVADIISNLHGVPGVIGHAEMILPGVRDQRKAALYPDLLITFGKGVLSKQLKKFLREGTVRAHWHISDGLFADSFQSITRYIQVNALQWWESYNDVKSRHENSQSEFFTGWQDAEVRARLAMTAAGREDRGELVFVQQLIPQIPPGCNLHLANSMSVRYANLADWKELHPTVRVYANRGTSGIDGCSSTAVGHSLVADQLNILITGDMAFFYDRNAFWHNYPVDHLRIILLNNHGGSIFSLIDGPQQLPELDEFFITRQRLTAKNLCEEYGFEYKCVDISDQAKIKIDDFFKPGGGVKVLEATSSTEVNRSVYSIFQNHIKKQYEL